MKANLKILWMMGLLALGFAERVGLAGPVGPLTTFTAGTPAKASEVNGNFSAVKGAVDDNHSRITTLEGAVFTGGNLVLAPSTPTTGNILKGTVPFIHNFGSFNTFIGENAGNFTMTGDGSNSAMGAGALAGNTTGHHNAAFGVGVLPRNTTGNGNTAIGAGALVFNTTGGANTASGLNALAGNTTGDQNSAFGQETLSNNAGDGNTAVGALALFSNTTGTDNIAIGRNAGNSLTTGSNNIAIGNAGVAGEAATTRIGSVQTRAFVSGIRGVNTGFADAISVVIDSAGQLGTLSSSRRVKDDIADMAEASGTLMKLRPVTFHYKSDDTPAGRTLQYGLVAEEVAAVAPELVARSADGQIETVYYQFLAPMLLNEFQKQQRTIQAQAEQIAALERDRHMQTARIEALEKQSLEIAKLKRQGAQMASSQ